MGLNITPQTNQIKEMIQREVSIHIESIKASNSKDLENSPQATRHTTDQCTDLIKELTITNNRIRSQKRHACNSERIPNQKTTTTTTTTSTTATATIKLFTQQISQQPITIVIKQNHIHLLNHIHNNSSIHIPTNKDKATISNPNNA